MTELFPIVFFIVFFAGGWLKSYNQRVSQGEGWLRAGLRACFWPGDIAATLVRTLLDPPQE